jgi:hypothetical protein
MMELTLRRKGQFAVTWTESNETQCGALGTQVLSYVVTIVGNEKCLDRQGFLIDNNVVDEYFKERYKKVARFESCERIAMTACDELRQRLGKAPIDLIEVSVSGSTQAQLTARWERPAPKKPVMFG